MNRLSRWSRRKLGQDADDIVTDDIDETTLHDTTPETENTSDGEATADPAPDPGSLDASLPAPESLAPGSDIKAYLVPGVSAGLRKRALRQLFSADRYAVRDGLDDYDEDYRQRLKPLASEAAQRLRKWAERLDESADEPGEREQASEASAGHGDSADDEDKEA
ncbi:hypothetical protein GCM10007160_02510 [Litchfieldella qijiaojingensis]|uniref:DUF3306 domain-containing protein n=1 Tax=Litchfieldella qijiaojingensis TaxID=980347 RepID=A0ABQ2YCS2_9GAMM|nr:DUF3306 domain-containing protein [Halomonas qijiaojingensis]GGX78744.1 hypothetical protein GCM10007160_02510 [Halomonas qijiaojingensis]